MFALSFWSYEVGQQLVKATKTSTADKKFTMLDYALAGGFSAIPTTIITTPMERIKVMLQTVKIGLSLARSNCWRQKVYGNV